jgi:ParB-like chromosome segregation protein Spo0J
MIDLAIVYRDPAGLLADPRNTRTHSAEQIAQVQASILEFGFTNPILLKDDEATIGAGHARQLAALALALPRVPTITLRGLTPVQWRAYVIADNKLALNAGWDDALLKSEIEGLSEDGFDLALTGFGEAELTDLLGDGLSIEGDGDEKQSAIAGEFLKFDRQRIPLTDAEIEALNGLASRYVEIFGLAHGFARWLVEGKHLA